MWKRKVCRPSGVSRISGKGGNGPELEGGCGLRRAGAQFGIDEA